MAALESRRLHPLSWVFITATTLRGLVVPALLLLFASGGNPFARYELLSLLVVGPAFVAALLKQGVYNYRFADEELVIREGILFKKERHIPYDRVHNVGLVRNPFHRMLGVATARIETAAGGKPEAVMRVLTLKAVDELRRYALGKERAAALATRRAEAAAVASAVDADEAALPVESEAAAVGAGTEADEVAAPVAGTYAAADGAAEIDAASLPEATSDAGLDEVPTLLRVPVAELVRLGLISNRGFLVVAAAMGVVSQTNWWELDWAPAYEAVREAAPQWMLRLLAPGSTSLLLAMILGGVVLAIVLLRLFSIGWYVVKYYDFELRREDDDLRTEYGLLTRVSSLIPVRRIQLVTISASLLHRCFGRAGVDLETAGAVETEGGGDFEDQLGAAGLRSNRQWLAPIIAPRRAVELVRSVMREVDVDAVEWMPMAARTTARILKRSSILLAVAAAALMTVLEVTPIPLSGWHALWLPGVLGPLVYFGTTGWVRNAGYALTDDAVFYRSGWLRRDVSVVRFDKMQTVTLTESPFDRRHRMARVAVDTAGAGGEGHRIAIPYLDAPVARDIFARLYDETCTTEFSW